MSNARVTVTLPAEVVHAIDREEVNRSRFVLKAVSGELNRRKSEQLMQSLRHPHPETLEMAEVGLSSWDKSLADDASDLIAPGGGESVRWSAEHGWEGGDK